MRERLYLLAQDKRLEETLGLLLPTSQALDAPPPEARGNPHWSEYVGYYEERLGEVKEGRAAEDPLKWEGL